jgi:serine/threonine protein kinase/CHASE1-domain containing sensor protein
MSKRESRSDPNDASELLNVSAASNVHRRQEERQAIELPIPIRSKADDTGGKDELLSDWVARRSAGHAAFEANPGRQKLADPSIQPVSVGANVNQRLVRALAFVREAGALRAVRVTVAFGLLLTLIAFAWARASYLATRREREIEKARELGTVIREGFQLPMENAHGISELIAFEPELSEQAFDAFANKLVERHPGVAYVEWAPIVQDSERENFESSFRGRYPQYPEFRIREPKGDTMAPVDKRANYMPLVFMRPRDGIVHGLDITFESGRRTVVEGLAERGRPGASGKFRLVEDPPEVFSIAVYAPVYQPGQPRKLGYLRGMLVQLFRLKPTVENILKSHPLDGYVGFLIDQDADDASNALLYESQSGIHKQRTSASSDIGAYSTHFDLEGRHWSATFLPEQPARTPWSAWALMISGVALTFGLSLGLASRARIKRLEAAVKSAKELGQYQLVRSLGRGGMGTVYEAEHAMLRRPTAIKLVTEVTEEALVKFETEVRLTSQLSHPNTIAIYDYGRTQDGIFYYAMEYLKGVDLSRLIASSGPLPVARVAHFGRQIVGSLAEAHAHNFVHRDIKPQNIMLTERGALLDFIKVLDFGLVHDVARATDRESEIAGTFGYIAPEVLLEPDAVTPSADIFAVGVVLYKLLTGARPIGGGSMLEIAAQTLTAEITEPSMLRPEIADVPGGEALSAIIMQCLAKDPSVRPTARSLSSDLEPIAKYWSQADALAFWSSELGKRLLERREPLETIDNAGGVSQTTATIDVASRDSSVA